MWEFLKIMETLAEQATICLLDDEDLKKLEKKHGICLDEDEDEDKKCKKRKRQIFEEIIRASLKQYLLAAQVNAALLQECESPRKRIIRAENIRAAKLNKML